MKTVPTASFSGTAKKFSGKSVNRLVGGLAAVCISIVLYQSIFAGSDKPVQAAPPKSNSNLSYYKDAKPVLDKRCVVCHGCYDAPCQLKLGSFDGVMRGAHADPVYNGERLTAAMPTRLFEDATSLEQWRDRGFFSVTDSESAIMMRMLQQKQAHPLPAGDRLPKSFNLDLNRELTCPTADSYKDYIKEKPLWGMPYALPSLSIEEQQSLISWLEEGAAPGDAPMISQGERAQIAQWEAYFNQSSKKGILVSRYLFEHLFLAHLYFAPEQGERPSIFYKLVRSTTPPGEPVNIISTRRPFDDPGAQPVYYRLIPLKETIVHKLHMPFLLSDERMKKWNTWFYEAEYEVNALPGYSALTASNPFVTFAQIPTQARYRFMLDEAQYSIMQFIKGAVCRGQIALNVINDHFWVVFADPDLVLPEYDEAFMQEARQTIVMPAEAQSNALPTNWLKYAKRERRYLQLKSEYIKNHVETTVTIDTQLLWDGDGENDNLALTIFRHFDAASVVKGLVGEAPQTAWVITYPLFERIHYLLVAGYDVYGNMGHQLNSRMYMDFLRMEGEYNFLALLPKATRQTVREKWYRGSVSAVEEYVYGGNQYQPDSDIKYTTDEPLAELHARLKSYVSAAESPRHQLDHALEASIRGAAEKLNTIQGKPAEILPQASLVLLTKQSGDSQIYTLLSHNAYSNISHLFGEMERRLPAEDTLTFAPGVMTSHPNALFSVDIGELAEFSQAVSQLAKEQDYTALMQRWGIRRTHPEFWAFSDRLHETFLNRYPLEFGYFDYNRLENR